MSPIETTIEVNAGFKYLWLKYVTGTNLDQHCARCLNGQYSKKVSPDMDKRTIMLDEFPHKAIYLCGVAIPYKWDNNFHLAMIHAPGEIITFSSNGIEVIAKNARRIMFEDFNAKELSSNSNRTKREYHTCRNWIFANYAVANTLLT